MDEQRMLDNARNVGKWRPATKDLLRMVFDEGLLQGWPGEAASWAPGHALHMLGHIGAHEVAGRLFPLFDRENDWLSDRLAVVWSDMGPRAEPPLWEYLDDGGHDPENRGVVLQGLAAISVKHPDRREEIVGRMADLLRRAPAADKEASAYIVHVLADLRAVELMDVIAESFEQGKVDTGIMDVYDVDFLEG